jgi:predicted Zn-dependent protease with MMP-like domain
MCTLGWPLRTGRPRGYDRVVDILTFQEVVQTTLDGLPPWITAELENIVVLVEDRPNGDLNPEAQGILGLYEGVPLPERGFDYFGVAPDRITIFYASHLALGVSDAELAGEVRRTILHEIGHHLGIDDLRLDELGWG